MKKLIIGLMVLGSFSALATPEILQGSKNYEARYVNDDGSITIVGPRFSSPDGSGKLRLSVEDNNTLRGICKLYGEGNYVKDSDRYVYASGTLVRISKEGKFERFDSASKKNALQSLICLPAIKVEVPPSSNAATILTNDDGSKTVIKPRFSNADGKGNLELSVEDDSNLEGICKLFGLGAYVPHSSVFSYTDNTLVRISKDGKFERFDSGRDKNALRSLICE